MSLKGTIWALDQELPCAHKFVLVVLSDAADHEGQCWPSQSAIADKCGLSRQYVNKILGDLERDGFVSIIARNRPNGSDASCKYRLAIPPECEAFVEPADVPGFVYVVSGSTATKIGISRDVERRVAGLSAQNAEPVRLVKSWPTTMRQARIIEERAHKHFAERRRHGEWFEIEAGEAIDQIDRLVVSTEKTPVVSTELTGGVNREDTQVSTEKTPNEPTTKNLPKNLSRSSAVADGEFEAWWKEVPRKVGKGQARKAYRLARKKASLEELLLSIRRYAAGRDGEDPQYTVHPATWLNGERWLDGAESPGPPPDSAPRRPATPPPLDDLNEQYRPDWEIPKQRTLPDNAPSVEGNGLFKFH